MAPNMAPCLLRKRKCKIDGTIKKRCKTNMTQNNFFIFFWAKLVFWRVSLLQGLSGTSGFYAEPRRDDGRAPSNDSMVIWVPNGNLEDAVLKSRTIERVLAICRFGGKYGIRVAQKDAEATHSKLNPDVPFQDFHIQFVYEIRPLPHGTQRAGVIQLLKKWHWKARPLQPHHSDPQGMGWLVGAAVEPPAMLFPAEQVTVVLHRKMMNNSSGP